jgi:hypothetical protein
MQPDGQPQPSQKPLDYEAPLPKASRVITIPRGLYSVHRTLLDNVEVVSIVYGLLVMTIGWLFKIVGIAFVVRPKGLAA